MTSIGVQKFIFRPAALGRTRTADEHTKAGEIEMKELTEGSEEEDTGKKKVVRHKVGGQPRAAKRRRTTRKTKKSEER